MTTESKFFIGIGAFTVMVIVLGVLFLGNKKPQTEEASILTNQQVLGESIRHAIGNPEAPVKIVEFSDFQCPACATAAPITRNVVNANQDKVYFVFRHFPLSSHKNAKKAAQAAEAASNQEKFWEMHDMIFENQNEWSNSSDAKGIFTEYAKKIGLDIDKFKQDFESVKDPIEQDFADGNRVGIDSTPTFFINGTKYSGVIQQLQFQEIINQASTSK